MEKPVSKANRFFEHFEQLAPTYDSYKKRYSYYWNDITNYYNYFIHEEDSVLEVGCGTGDTISKLKGKKKAGLDFSPAMIEVAKKQHPSIDFYLMDAADISLTEKFDVIVLSSVIGCVDNVLDVFNSLKAVCHEHTRIIISYYNYLWEPFLKFGELIGIKK